MNSTAAFAVPRAGVRVDGNVAPSAMFEPVACYYCGSHASEPFITAEDDLTGRPGVFHFVRCLDCSLVYQSPRLTLPHVKTFYDDEYIAHRSRGDWGWMSALFAAAIRALDRKKLSILTRHVTLDPSSHVLDVGCGAGTFLAHVQAVHGCCASGMDFVDLADRPALRNVDFRCGLFRDQTFAGGSFDAITMWHFLEHDYDPLLSLRHAARLLKRDGCLVVEVPRLDSLSFKLFKGRWPGLQAPQHTALYDRAMLVKTIERAGLEVVEYLPCGAFPPYFYLFCGAAFTVLKGRGLNMRFAIYPYFAGQLLLLPLLPLLDRMNLAMQTVVCRRRHVA